MPNYTMPLAIQIVEDCGVACQDAGGIIHSFLISVASHEAALAPELPNLFALIFGVFSPATAFPNPMFPGLPLGGVYNRFTHAIFGRLHGQGSRLGYGWLRRQHPHLPPLDGWPFAARPSRRTLGGPNS